MRYCRFLFLILALAFCVWAGDTVRPGLEGIEWKWPGETETALIKAIKEPFLAGMNVQAALQDWFDGRLLDNQGKANEAEAKWKAGLTKLDKLEKLPKVQWAPMPDATFTKMESLTMASHSKVALDVVSWQVGKLKQYGVILYPKNRPEGAEYPLMLYCHGAAFGLPNDFMNWLAVLVERGYVVIGPAMRGEPLFQWQLPIQGKELTSEGEIENFDGEVDDCLAMVSAAWKLPFVRKNEFGTVGHSFGSGIGLLCTARAGAKAKVAISYDAWFVNPQRYYWDRMRRGARNWDSWEDYCNQPVLPQLNGLMKRSLVRNADKFTCPALLFLGGAYQGSVFHQSHDDLKKELEKLHRTNCEFVVVEGGDHNFVLRTESEPAKKALKLQTEFLDKHYPPYKAPVKP